MNSPLYGFDNLSYIERFFYKKIYIHLLLRKILVIYLIIFQSFQKFIRRFYKKIFIDEFTKIKSADLILINAEGVLVENYENPKVLKKYIVLFVLLYFLKVLQSKS